MAGLFSCLQVTAVADFVWGYLENLTLCTAHKYNVRVLGLNQYPIAHLLDPEFYENSTVVDEWVYKAFEITYDYGLDRIMLVCQLCMALRRIIYSSINIFIPNPLRESPNSMNVLEVKFSHCGTGY